MTRHASTYPVTLQAQLRDKLGWYAGGGALLFVQQLLMARRDFFVRDAVDAANQLRAGDAKSAALAIILVSIVAASCACCRASRSSRAAATWSTSCARCLLARLAHARPSFFRNDADRRDHEPRDQRPHAGAPAARLRHPQRHRAPSRRS
jgi:ATP-binding cassette subfamily B multidrug efflux pump